MNVLSVENLTKSYGDKVLFNTISFGIEQGQKVALVAKNGNGKSTLLKCIIGQEFPDDGRVVFRNGIEVGYLEQTENLNPTLSVLDAVLDQDLAVFQVVKKYKKAMKNNDEDTIANLFEEMSTLNAWDLEFKVEQMLGKLKLDQLTMPINNLSGGQKKRVALAKVLLAEPDFLILDEPTNHLDLDMIEWLEDYLSGSKSTMLLVTHDRYFLEVVADTIIELEDQTIFKYRGNFSYYLEKKAEREELEAVTVGKARSHMKKELEWIRRQPKARGTKQKARIDSFHETKKVASKNLQKDELEIETKMERLGTKILEIHSISKAFGDLKILDKLSYTFKRKERLGIVGANGTGKSTFLKMIMGEEAPDNGKIVVGETVAFGYYSQESIEVDEDKKVIDVIRDIAEFIPLAKGREMSAAQFLEKFLFPRSMHYSFVHKLSGGEKRRLKLMTVLMANPNFLILDEPTNDLDIFILSVLEDYLKNFEGCLIIVSHDRYFMDKMVDHIFVFEGNGVLKDIIGNYSTYREVQKAEKKELQELAAKQRQEEKQKDAKEVKSSRKKQEQKQKLSFKEQKEFEQLEKEIAELETQKEILVESLSDSSKSGEEMGEISKQLTIIIETIDAKTERWLELAEFA